MDLLDSLLEESPKRRYARAAYPPTPKGVAQDKPKRCPMHHGGAALNGIRCQLHIDHIAERPHFAQSKSGQSVAWSFGDNVEDQPPKPPKSVPYELHHYDPPTTLEALLLELPTADQPVFIAGWYSALGAAEAVLAERTGGANWDYAHAYGDCQSDIEELAKELPRPEYTKGL